MGFLEGEYSLCQSTKTHPQKIPVFSIPGQNTQAWVIAPFLNALA
jgi:hypothetical protein